MSEPWQVTHTVAVVHSEREKVYYRICAIVSKGQLSGFAVWSSAAASWIYGSLECPMKAERCWQIVREHC